MKAIILYGPPGSGKGTQAELLARKGGSIHFDTGQFIERLVHSPEALHNPILTREKKLFDAGILCTPSWVLSTIKNATKKIAKAGYNVVYSGSPRTLFEAFGDKKNRGLIYELNALYGKKNVVIIHLKIATATCATRNAARFICSVCGLPRLAGGTPASHCVFCGGKLMKRTLDDPKVIVTRMKEYETRTAPIFNQLKKEGYSIHNVDGNTAPYKVMEKIEKALKE